MSDLSMYELEDIIWDEFDRSDDHIVPHTSNDRGSGHSCEGDSCKKPRREVTAVLSNAINLYASDCVCQGKEEKDSTALNKKRNMLEKDPWSHTPDGVFSASCDGDTVKDVTSLASDDTRTSSHCFKSSNLSSMASELCTDDPVCNDRSTAGDGSSYSYPLRNIPQTDDLSFFENDCEDKESSDLLYYGWPDIENFEDVDRMLRSCDSSFGLGVTGNEDELGWFSSAGPIGGPQEAMKLDFKFPSPQTNALKNISEDCEPPEPNNKRSNYLSETRDEFKLKEQGVESNDVVHLENETTEHSKKDNRMITLRKKQSKHQNQTEGKRAAQCLGNDGSFYHICDLQINGIHLSSMDASHHAFTSIGNRQQKQNVEPDSFGYMQTNNPYLHADYGHPIDQVGQVLSGIKSENKRLKSFSPKESSYASNQVQSTESSCDPSFQETAVKVDEKREKVHHPHGFQPSFTSNPRHLSMMVQASKWDPVSAKGQAHLSANEFESQSGVEGVRIGVPEELGSLNVQESSSANSRLDEISLEATSFCQLQQVMEQLDLRTKLCIRDSLYRLARSAEQRHNHANLSGSCTEYRDTGGALMAEGTNKCTGFMDIETDTNPIDRSIAHLLFHRPSDSPNVPGHLPLKSNAVIHGSITSPPMMIEKLVHHEEAAAESDDRIADI